jgi:DNA replication ATP-dependent helicase Dna2
MDAQDADIAQIGDLLRDWRRINVSFTRAKRKLVIFGSRKTLASDCLLAGFLRLMDSKNWIYALPKGADELHPLPDNLESKAMSMKGKGGVKQEGEKVRDGKGERKVGRAAEGILNGRPFGKEVLAVSCYRRFRDRADEVTGGTRECICGACLIQPLRRLPAVTACYRLGESACLAPFGHSLPCWMI